MTQFGSPSASVNATTPSLPRCGRRSTGNHTIYVRGQDLSQQLELNLLQSLWTWIRLAQPPAVSASTPNPSSGAVECRLHCHWQMTAPPATATSLPQNTGWIQWQLLLCHDASFQSASPAPVKILNATIPSGLAQARMSFRSAARMSCGNWGCTQPRSTWWSTIPVPPPAVQRTASPTRTTERTPFNTRYRLCVSLPLQ